MMQAVWNKKVSKKQKYIGKNRPKKEKIEKRKKAVQPVGRGTAFFVSEIADTWICAGSGLVFSGGIPVFFTVCACSGPWHVRCAMRRIQHFWQKRLF